MSQLSVELSTQQARSVFTVSLCSCNHTFNAPTHTAVGRLALQGQGLNYEQAIVQGLSIRKAAVSCGIVKDNMLYAQAGAGIVADSNPNKRMDRNPKQSTRRVACSRDGLGRAGRAAASITPGYISIYGS